MSDEKLVKMARLAQRDDRMATGALYGDLADRIEALTAERDEHWKSFVHWRKEADALTEQLEAARADAKEAEAYAEELAGDQVDLCSQLIAAEAKLAKAVSLTVRADNLREAYHALPNDHNRIGDKRSRKGHAREAWLRAFRKAAKTSRAIIAEIEGEKG